MNQYQVAALQPPHLAAICPWEGAADWYRDFARHGGILCQFAQDWYPRQVETVQHGVGDRGHFSAVTGEAVSGPDTVDSEVLATRRADLAHDVKSRPLIDDWYLQRNPDWSRVMTPMLSAGNWGGHGLHLRGNVEAFTQSATTEKWLEIHGDAHWVDFYTDRGVALQKRFFGHYLKGETTGWSEVPRVLLRIRHADGTFTDRAEHEWPLARTDWTRYRLTPDLRLVTTDTVETGSIGYDASGDGLTFMTDPFDEETEVTGPLAARLFISSDTADADLFLVVRLFDVNDDEVTFMGALDPNTPVAHGWLRASHRALDQARTLPHRPYHSHDRMEPLVPGEVYPLEVEIWPTSIMVPAEYRLGLTIRGNDYRFEGELSDFAQRFHYAGRGVGPFKHADPDDRPEGTYAGRVTVRVGGETDSYLLVPIIR
jgi:predicted acyl esterase